MEKVKFLKQILINENVVDSIKENIGQLKAIIPEIIDTFSFDQNHPHHHLDVWEHTLCALNFSPNDFDIRLALLLHDIGKPHSYQDQEVRHFKGHPEKSASISRVVLKRLGFNEDYIAYICQIILKHDTPLTKEDIDKNYNLAKVIFEVQKCDALAHNPTKNKKRLEYIDQITKLLEK